jgi:iron complex outermembrane receptor protein
MRKTLSILGILVTSFCSYAQTPTDSIQTLDEVVLSDNKLKNYAAGVKIETLSDSTLTKNPISLTGVLAFNSNIYFKENGFGMISSPSFRGTNASQTAVIWNGININSQLNGQTDFNTVNTTNYSSIDIRSGGGSVQYGSGSIGGSVHLNNKLEFYSHFKNRANLSYGSFDTRQGNYTTSYGTDKFSGNLGVSYIDSENDYRFLGTDNVNTNGQFNNFNVNVNLGYFISDKDVLKLYQQSFKSERNLSGTLVARSRSKYDDENYRTMLEWSRVSGNYNSKLKVAHLQEFFRYFENKNKENYSFGKVNTYLINHSFNYRFSEKLQVKTILDYNSFEGSGSSFGEPSRSAFSATALLNHKPTENLSYGVNIRKDFTSGFTSPLVFSIDGAYQLTKHYTVQLNGSKNFRAPTFNDLYWQPGGNLDLVPESSYQLDFGQQFNYKSIALKLNGYYINTTDLIQWRPDTTGTWSPINIAETESYGAELELQSRFKFKKHYFNVVGHYSYTISEDATTKKQLVYVPFHKGNISLAYNYKQFSMFYQHLFNGEVFKIDRKILPTYDVGNMGVSYAFNTKGKINYELDFRVNNIYNRYYENVALRPMPNRNFQIQTTIKF